MSADFKLSDQIKVLRDRFKGRPMLTMNGDGVDFITGQIEALRQAALSLEQENMRLRWQAASSRGRDEEDRIVEEACRPGSNLKLFPASARPVFGGGAPKGAA